MNMERKRRTLSRREFLKLSGLTTLLAALSTALGCNAFPTPETEEVKKETPPKPEKTPFIGLSKELADYITQPQFQAAIFAIDESIAHSTTPERLAEVYKTAVLKQPGTINEAEKIDLSSFVSVTNAKFTTLSSQLETQVQTPQSSPEQLANIAHQIREHLIRGVIEISFQHLRAEHTNNFDLLCSQINRKIELMLLANHWASWFELKKAEISSIIPLTQDQDQTISRRINEWRKIGSMLHRQLLDEYKLFKSKGWLAHWENQPTALKESISNQSHWLELANNVSSIEDWQSLMSQYFATRIEAEPELTAVYQQQYALLSQSSDAMPIQEVAKNINPDGIFFTQAQIVAVESGFIKIQYSNQKCSFNQTESLPLSALGLQDNIPVDQLFLIVDQISPLYVEVDGNTSLALSISLRKNGVVPEYQEIIFLTNANFQDQSINTRVNTPALDSRIFTTPDQLNGLTELQFTKGTSLEISKLHLAPTQMMSLILSEDDPDSAIRGVEQAIGEFGGNVHYRQLAMASPQAALYRDTNKSLQVVGSLGQLAGYEDGLLLPVIPDQLLNSDFFNRSLGILNQTGKNVFLPVPNTDLYIALDDISVKIIGQKSSASYYANRYQIANLLIALNRVRFEDLGPKKYQSPPSSPAPTLTLLEELQGFFSMRTVKALLSNPKNHPLVGIPAIMTYGSSGNKESYLPYIPGASQYFQLLVEIEQNERLFLDGSSLPNKKTISLDN